MQEVCCNGEDALHQTWQGLGITPLGSIMLLT